MGKKVLFTLIVVVIRWIAIIVVVVLMMWVMCIPIAFSFALSLSRATIQNAAVRLSTDAVVICPLWISDTHFDRWLFVYLTISLNTKLMQQKIVYIVGERHWLLYFCCLLRIVSVSIESISSIQFICHLYQLNHLKKLFSARIPRPLLFTQMKIHRIFVFLFFLCPSDYKSRNFILKSVEKK